MSDIAGYLRTAEQAQEKSGAADWPAAAALWQRVVRDNPVHGGYWDCLARARYELGDFGVDPRRWIAPEIYVPVTFEAYRRNADPALDAILAAREHLPGT